MKLSTPQVRTAWKQIGIIAFRRDFLLKFLQLTHTSLEKIESVDMLRVLEHGYDLKWSRSKMKLMVWIHLSIYMRWTLY